MTYTYDPLLIARFGKDQMRFELGDTTVEGNGETSALCDEEYETLLHGVTQESWRNAKLTILSAILHKLAFQVDTKIDTLEYHFSHRATSWEKLYQDLKEELEEEEEILLSGIPSIANTGRGHFWDGMHDYKKGSLSCSFTPPSGIGRWR